ncbi:histidine kinase-like ATPase [Russula earlei]|uniref:Histidine kinase-like ATPase n=1 Tax=Russula earlei TaxID=71964 RepID=A0ACC0U507_9AGAM|nr:histidine kinase-like ATPase [Russula earlei]
MPDMTPPLAQAEDKLTIILKYAPLGLAEIDESGKIVLLNIVGEILLAPVIAQHHLQQDNIYPILEFIAPSIPGRIKAFSNDAGVIVTNELHSYKPASGEVKYFNFIVSKVFPGCIMISFDDITEKHLKEQAVIKAELDKAIEQGKFEIASGILHDIGNAVVGFGSYLTRIKRLLEQSELDNLEQLVTYFKTQQNVFAAAIGADKTTAIIDMLNGITRTQTDSRDEIKKSITEQLNIISHIQDILNIQRQYITGQEVQERSAVNLRTLINDCMAMLFASFDKRDIAVTLDIPAQPVMVKGDRTKLMQLILNLLKNSLEAIPLTVDEKSIYIRVYQQPGETTILEIKDSGHGFDASTAARLFERGFTTKATGSGVGLYNCQSIVESHGGSMRITSEGPDKGALVEVYFPG